MSAAEAVAILGADYVLIASFFAVVLGIAIIGWLIVWRWEKR